jgi:hypothetical protein
MAESPDGESPSGWASIAGDNDFVDYTVTHDLTTDHVRKVQTTSISIYPFPWGCSFAQTDEILGSREGISTHSTRYHGIIAKADVTDLLDSLKDLGIVSITPEPRNLASNMAAQLVGKIGTNRFWKTYALTQNSNTAMRVHCELLAIGQEISQKYPAKIATMATESDLAQPQFVSLRNLVENAPAFDGKRIQTAGWYLLPHFEESYLYTDEDAARNRGKRVWIGKPSSFADHKDIERITNGWVMVTGIFNKGLNGRSEAEITRLTLLRLTSPERAEQNGDVLDK